MIEANQPVLLVVHDADDGGWQFLTGDEFTVADARIVTLASILAIHPTLATLANLPPGWQAWRTTPEAPWHRSHAPLMGTNPDRQTDDPAGPVGKDSIQNSERCRILGGQNTPSTSQVL